jgi:hypothetical protein
VDNDLVLLADTFVNQKRGNVLTLITAQLHNLAEIRICLNRSVAVEVLQLNPLDNGIISIQHSGNKIEADFGAFFEAKKIWILSSTIDEMQAH